MTQYLPPNLLALFAPRDPIPYLPPLDKLPHEKKLAPYTGVSAFLNQFEDPKDTPPPTRVETKDERKERKRKERAEQVAYKLEQDLALWDPHNDPQATGDPFKSLFVGRINYDTSESKLRREFEVYGPVKRINMVTNKSTGKPRGYAFVEYEHERDMHSAYKHADGKKIDGRRVLVDVERSRTVKGWRPRRLGGGLGGTRKGGPEVNTKYSGRDDGSSMHRDREDRSASPRERGGRRDRSRSRDRERPRRRSRSRERRPRRSRSRDRDRESRRDRGDRGRADREEREDKKERFDDDMGMEEERRSRKRRSRSRDRKRSRSRDRKRSRRSRSPRERRGRDRSRDRGHGGGGAEESEYQNEMDYSNIHVKEEPNGEGYDAYAAYAAAASATAEETGESTFQNYAMKPPRDDDDENPPPPVDPSMYAQYPQTNEYGSSYQGD